MAGHWSHELRAGHPAAGRLGSPAVLRPAEDARLRPGDVAPREPPGGVGVAGGAPGCGRRAGGGGVSTRRQSATYLAFLEVFGVFLMNLLVAQKLILKIWC